MKSDTGEQLIGDYLRRLEGAAQALPPDRRGELLAEIREHIADARTEDAVRGEAEIRGLLERLGSPEEIVAAAAEETVSPWSPAGPQQGGFPAAATGRPRRSLALEIGAVVMLTAGSFVPPLLGWLVGVALLWSSDRWRVREKVLGTLVVPGGLCGLVLYGTLGFGTVHGCFTSSDGQRVLENTCDDHPVRDIVQPTVAVLVAVAALLVPLILLHLARRRANAEAAEPAVSPAGPRIG